MSIFQERLRHLKESSGATQAKIASDLGITPQALSYYMNGREPSYDVLVDIADYFDVSIDYLLGKSDYVNRHQQCNIEHDYSKFEELFAQFDSNLFHSLTKNITKILQLDDLPAKRALIWNIVLSVGFHMRILELYSKYRDLARTINDAETSNAKLKIDLGRFSFSDDKNPEEIYYLVQNSFITQALNENAYIYQETQKMIDSLYEEICKLNNLSERFGDKFKIKMPPVQEYVSMDNFLFKIEQDSSMPTHDK